MSSMSSIFVEPVGMRISSVLSRAPSLLRSSTVAITSVIIFPSQHALRAPAGMGGAANSLDTALARVH